MSTKSLRVISFMFLLMFTALVSSTASPSGDLDLDQIEIQVDVDQDITLNFELPAAPVAKYFDNSKDYVAYTLIEVDSPPLTVLIEPPTKINTESLSNTKKDITNLYRHTGHVPICKDRS